MASIITLTFSGQPSVDEAISISRDYNGDEIKQTFKNLRFQNFQSTIGGNVEDTVINLRNAFQTDFSLFGWTYQNTETELIITAESENGIFDNFLNETSNIAVAVENTALTTFEILGIQLVEASSNPCENIGLTITANSAIRTVSIRNSFNQSLIFLESYLENDNITEVTIDIPRSFANIDITLFGWIFFGASDQENNFNTPGPIQPQLELTQTDNGTTAQISTLVASGVNYNLEYALRLQGDLNSPDYQSSNTFTGLLDGNYEGFIKDGFGCEKMISFSVFNNIEITAPPFIDYPLINMIYAKEINDLKLNNENTLSYETTEDNNIYPFQHVLSKKEQYNQSIWIQYKSSYKDNYIKFFKGGEEVFELTPSQLTENINFSDKRDGEIFSFNGKLAVKYNGGNIYDDQNTVIGQSTLFGELLFNQVAGELVLVENFGTLPISQVVIDSSIGTFMVFDSNYTGVNQTQKITFRYNIEGWEIFEFQRAISDLEGCYQFVICATNEDARDFEADAKFISEVIDIQDIDLHEYFTLKYWNKENNEIAWQSGIQTVINIPKLIDNTYEPKQENDIFTSDEKTLLLDAQSDEVYVFRIKSLPLNIVKQIATITSNDQLELDGLTYVKEEAPDIEPLIGSGEYTIDLRLTKTKGFANNSRRGINDLQISGNGLLTNENGFLEI